MAAIAAAGPVSAHHSWSAEYDLSRSTYVTGTVVRVLMRNPHSALVVNVNADNGRQERWTVEWASPQRLRERGVTERSLRAGERVQINGNPHRDSKVRALRAVSVRRGDGTEIGNAGGAGR
jgi:DNA/RNA endonuclease YhcR with UshA esterase domain